ncbi:LysR family transcriptional regulator [Oceanicola sp. S124]|uniref:LysR family transcriptional regulator n=1 Tax=Oceanicola sp. S124 TaxID=1042378 RepID=UPI0002558518|nr:LysR family transcriptional regulator [Oceanicola sp. S124]
MQIHSLRTFYWVTRLSSFRRAAEVLNISQPTVSARIRGLEEELGVTLLDRTGGLALTAPGEELLDYARQVLRLTEDLSFHRSPDVRATRLRLGANGPVAATWLMPMVRDLETRHPDLRLEIEVNQSATLLRHLSSGQLDIGFVTPGAAAPGLRLTPLGSFAMTWVGAAGQFPGRMSDEQIGASPIIGYSWDSPVHGTTHAPAFGPGRHHRFSQSDSLFMMIRLAVEGAGLALVPEAAVAREVARGDLCRITAETPPQPLSLAAAQRRESRGAAAESALRYALAVSSTTTGMAAGPEETRPEKTGIPPFSS